MNDGRPIWIARLALAAALCLTSITCAELAPCVAWGQTGHRVVAELAERRLAPGTRESLRKLIGDRSLADVSSWADRIRERRRFEWTRPLHYVNLPDDAEGYDSRRDCPDGACVVEAVGRFAREVSAPELGKKKRAEALKFLVHLVADIHQPLHVSRGSDLGGNTITVVHGGERLSLHRLWDTTVVEKLGNNWRDIVDKLDRGAFARPSADFEAWANESWRLALRHAYALPADRVIDDAWLERGASVAADRLVLAGVRLASLLDTIFEERSSSTGRRERARSAAESIDRF